MTCSVTCLQMERHAAGAVSHQYRISPKAALLGMLHPPAGRLLGVGRRQPMTLHGRPAAGHPPDLSVDVYPVTPAAAAASHISGGGTKEIEEHFGALDESAHSRCS